MATSSKAEGTSVAAEEERYFPAKFVISLMKAIEGWAVYAVLQHLVHWLPPWLVSPKLQPYAEPYVRQEESRKAAWWQNRD